MDGIKILGTGRCVPTQVITNEELSRRVDTSDEWITSRTGIRRRHHCGEESPIQMCVQAARGALEKAGVAPEEIGACIVATLTPEYLVPSTACMLQKELGLPTDIICFDLNAACTGFLFALHTMECLLNAAPRKFGLVVGAEALSSIINWEDRGTCILFGDGAGAAVVECREGWKSIGATVGCRGDDKILHVDGPASGKPSFISMEGQQVFKFAVEAVPWCMDRVLEQHNMTPQDVDFFVFHQANARIIDLVVRKYKIPPEKYYKNLEEYGNTSAASIPLVISELEEQGKIGPGSRLLVVGFGGGLTWGGAMVEYAQGEEHDKTK